MSELFLGVVDSLATLPPGLVYLVIGLLGAVENVFPPIPADSAIALGAFLSRSVNISATTIFMVTWSANVASAIVVYGVARRYGRGLFRGRFGRKLINPRLFGRIEELYEAHGTWGIFLSRFVPGVRAVVAPFAGIAGLSAPKAIAPVVVASALWYGTITFLAARIAQELETLLALIARFNTVMSLMFVCALTVGVIWWISRRRARGRS